MADAVTFRDWHREPSDTEDDQRPGIQSASTVSDSESRGFRNLIMRAAGWTVIGYIVPQVLRIASSLILTRLLIPEMFGIMAVAIMVQISIAMLSDLGLRPAAIQSKMGDNQTYLDTAWTLQFLHGCLIWFTCILVAIIVGYGARYEWFPEGSVYTAPELPTVIIAASFGTIIMGLQSTKIITAYRNLNLGRLTVIEIVAQIISLATAVLLAFYTGSIWSFVISALVSSLVTAILSHVWLPGVSNRFRVQREALSDLLRFGRWILLSSILTVIAANGDRILLAGWTSPTMLGLYILALNLIAMLEGAGGRLFSSVAMPALSKIARERPEDLPAVFLKMRLPFDLVFIGSAGAVYSGGRMLIEFLYDDRYVDAALIIEILSFSLIAGRFLMLSAVYQAVNEPRNQSVLNLVRAISIFVCLPVAYYGFGFEGALWAIALHSLPILPFVFYFNRRNRLNNPLYEISVLFVWPVGYLAGHLAVTAVEMIGISF